MSDIRGMQELTRVSLAEWEVEALIDMHSELRRAVIEKADERPPLTMDVFDNMFQPGKN